MDYFSQTFSNHLLLMDNLLPSSYIYLQKAYFLIFFACLFWFIHDLMPQFLHTENIFHLYFWIYCCSFLSYPVWKIDIWTSASKIYFMKFVIHQLDWIKNKYHFLSLMFLNFLDILKEMTQRFINNFIYITIRCKF